MKKVYLPRYEREKKEFDYLERGDRPVLRALKEMEIEHVYCALQTYGWNRSKAAKAIGISPHSMQMKIKEYQKRGVVIPDNPEYPNGVHINAEK